MRNYWDKLQAELKGKTLELRTWSIAPRSGSFYARAVSDRIFIEGKNIKGIRTIAFTEFEKMAKYYNDYIDGAAGVKQKMRDELGYNTPYILTLLHHILIEPPTEPEPKVLKRDAPERKRYYGQRPQR